MRTVQDRLLTQMVSRPDRFDPSALELDLFRLLLLFFANDDYKCDLIFWSECDETTCPCFSFLQHEGEIQTVRRSLHALFFP